MRKTTILKICRILSVLALYLWKTNANQCITALYAFGDSYTDTGNALISNPPVYGSIIGNLPYGETFFGSPTGRCSDGRLVIDFMTAAMGQGMLPPYLKVAKLPLSERSKGVNFAVAGAPASDSGRLLLQYLLPTLTPLSLNKQVEWFKQLKASSECDVTVNTNCGDGHFANALYLIGEIGVNDYLASVFLKRPIEFTQKLIPQVIGEVINGMEMLMEVSSPKYLIVQGIPAFGCFPSVLSVTNSSSPSDYDNNGCLTEVNQVAISHNAMLKSYLEQLRQRFPGIRIEYEDYYEFFTRAVTNNRLSLKACCGSGGGPYNFDFRGLCGVKVSIPKVTKQFTTCPDPSAFFSWDGIHLTEASNRDAFDFFSSSSSNSVPLNYC